MNPVESDVFAACIAKMNSKEFETEIRKLEEAFGVEWRRVLRLVDSMPKENMVH